MTRLASQASCGDWRSRYADEAVVVPVPVLGGAVLVVPLPVPVLGGAVLVPLPVLVLVPDVVLVVVLLGAADVATGTTVHQ